MTQHHVDVKSLPVWIQRDILEYCKENHRDLPTTQTECLEFYLEWNGIIGYTRNIRRAVLHIMAADIVYLTKTDAEKAAWLRDVLEAPGDIEL